jgi:uncharacterized protein YecE (DUF72 family)
MKTGNIYIGTSGWNYDHWKGTFYPDSKKKRDWFSLYQSSFSTVEINNTFYNLPSEETVDKWHADSNPDFLYSIKASRYITHMKKLKDPEQSTPSFFSVIRRLGEKAGPVLFQLPPKWNRNTERLKGFLESLPDGYQYTFEFRDPSWFHSDIYKLLSEFNAAFCIYHLEGNDSPRELTADFVYIRLHGPDGAYRGKYGKRELSGWAGAITAWKNQGRDIYCYFNNDENGFAPQNALELLGMLEG